MKTLRAVIFSSKRGQGKTVETQPFLIHSSAQLESVINLRRDPHYFKFLHQNQPVAPEYIGENVALAIVRDLGSNEKVSNTSQINRILAQNIDLAFSLAYRDPEKLNGGKENIRDTGSLMSTYLTMSFNNYEKNFKDRCSHLLMAISAEDDIQEMPSGFDKYDYDGFNTCYSSQNENITKKLFELVMEKLKMSNILKNNMIVTESIINP